MAKNDFKAFAIGENANTLSQEEYESSDFIGEGFKSGIARSERLNKVWRQSSVIAAVIGKYIAEKTGEDVMDDGDLEKLVAQLDLALKHKITTEIPAASLTQKGISQLNSATNSDREDQAATPKSVHDVRKIAESKLSGVSDASLTQKGIVQLSNATNSTNETLAATPKAIKEAYDFANTANVAAKNAHDEANRATDNANSRLAKNQNGADIPNKSEFIKNLGLTETVELAKSAVSASGGDYAASFRFKQIGTIPTERNETILVSEDGPRNPNKIVAFTLYNWYGNYINTGIVRGGGADTLGYAIDINKKRVLTVSPDGKVNATSFITGSGGMQTGAKDAASFEGNNIEIQSWYGIGLKATIDGETRTFFDTRTGNIITKGTFGIGDDCNGIRGGGRDAASFEGNNIEVVSWYGIGLKSTLDNKTRIFFNTRNGDIFTKGTIHIGDAIHYYDGNTTGSIWGGDLHSYINNNFSRKNDGIPVGSPIPWPLPNPPSGYLTCNGQSFNKSLYPQLAVAYPSGVLPDLRGEFIRGWDDGRGVDGGRGILSWQPQQVQWHQHLGGHGGRAQGAFGVTNLAGHPGSYHDDSKQTLPFTNNGSDFQGFTNNGAVGAETRPRNIAFNYIVRAA